MAILVSSIGIGLMAEEDNITVRAEADQSIITKKIKLKQFCQQAAENHGYFEFLSYDSVLRK